MLIPRTFSLICICMCMCIRRSTHARTHTRTHTRIHTHAHTPIASYSTHTRMLSPLPCFYLPLFPPSSPPFFLPLPSLSPPLVPSRPPSLLALLSHPPLPLHERTKLPSFPGIPIWVYVERNTRDHTRSLCPCVLVCVCVCVCVHKS